MLPICPTMTFSFSFLIYLLFGVLEQEVWMSLGLNLLLNIIICAYFYILAPVTIIGFF